MTTSLTISLILPFTSEIISLLIGPETKTIRDLIEYISKKFKINEKVTLNINDCILPLDESIKIIKQYDTIRIKTEIVTYLPFTPEMRIQLDLSRYFSLNRNAYILISPNIKTVEDLCNHISTVYFINEKFTLRAKHSTFDLKELCTLKSEDEVRVIPEYIPEDDYSY